MQTHLHTTVTIITHADEDDILCDYDEASTASTLPSTLRGGTLFIFVHAICFVFLKRPENCTTITTLRAACFERLFLWVCAGMCTISKDHVDDAEGGNEDEGYMGYGMQRAGGWIM